MRLNAFLHYSYFLKFLCVHILQFSLNIINILIAPQQSTILIVFFIAKYKRIKITYCNLKHSNDNKCFIYLFLNDVIFNSKNFRFTIGLMKHYAIDNILSVECCSLIQPLSEIWKLALKNTELFNYLNVISHTQSFNYKNQCYCDCVNKCHLLPFFLFCSYKFYHSQLNSSYQL